VVVYITPNICTFAVINKANLQTATSVKLTLTRCSSTKKVCLTYAVNSPFTEESRPAPQHAAKMAGGAVISANPLQLDIRSHKKCLFMCALVTISTFQYGLDYALVGGFMAMPGFLKVFGYFDEAKKVWAIDPTVQQLISSLMTIGTFVGSLLVGPFSSKFGRRHGLWVASVINFISTGIMIGTTNLGALYFARLILGKMSQSCCRISGKDD
jgi:hypothetical protein